MTRARIAPGVVSGRVVGPPSKSYTHRALVLGHLSHTVYRVEDPLYSEDTRATREGVRRLGSRVRSSRALWELRPRARSSGSATTTVDCAESGTTLRLLTAVAACRDRPVRLTGGRRLAERPLEPLLTSLRAHGVRASSPGGRAIPLDVRGPLHSGDFEIDASASSQFLSALLLVLPFLEGESTLSVSGTPVSRNYVDSTLAALRFHGVRVEGGYGRWSIPGSQRLRVRRFPIPPDASSAAYLWVGAAITGGEVVTPGAWGAWPQADLVALDVLRRSGSVVRRTPQAVEVEGRPRSGFEVDLTDSPDLFPLVGVLAATIPERSRLAGAPHLEGKESDRRRGTLELVRTMGATASIGPAGLTILGRRTPHPVTGFQSHDHRLVMSAAVAALAAERASHLSNPEAVRKSYPGFWAALARAGAEVGFT